MAKDILSCFANPAVYYLIQKGHDNVRYCELDELISDSNIIFLQDSF